MNSLQPKSVLRLIWRVFYFCFLWGTWASGQTSQVDLPHPASGVPRAPYEGIGGKQRFEWLVKSTVGPTGLVAGIFSAAITTAQDTPVEYGPHWEGFGKRYGMRLTGISTSNAMEAGFGALWGEDPRYFQSEEHVFQERVKHIVVMTFAARHRDGNLAPAYARFIAVPGSNFLSNTWRADSVANARDAGKRTAWGFLGQMGSNAFAEFWPDIEKRVFHRKR